MPKNLSDAERQYYVRKAGGASTQETVAQLKRRYWSSYLSAPFGSTFSDLETNWMIKFITTAGGTVVSTQNADLWKQMVIAVGKTPTKQTTGNKMIFYLNAP